VGFLILAGFFDFNPVKFAWQLFNRVNIFRATVVLELPLFEESEPNLSEIELEPEGELASALEGLTEKEEELSDIEQETEVFPEPLPADLSVEVLTKKEAPLSGAEEGELTLAEIQEMFDDVAERVDVINQEIAELVETELVGEVQQTPEELEPRELEESELREEEEQPEGEERDEEGEEREEEKEEVSRRGGGGLPTYSKILISEIQIAGKDSQKEEFVELYNPNQENLDLTNWYLQRKTKNASSFSSFAPKKLFSGKTIKAKDYFLIARENSSFVDLADIVTGYPLTEDNTLVLKDPNREIKDKVGWGEAQDFETVPFPQNPEIRDPIGDWLSEIGFKGSREPFPSTIYYQSLGRKTISEENNYQDTDNNAEDFKIQTPTPKAKNETFIELELEDVLKNIIDYYNTPIGTEIISGPDQLTDQTQATFEFQAIKENCSFECRLNEQDWQDCQSPQIYENLEEGQYTFSVRAIDLFSNVDPVPAEYLWTIKISLEEEDTTPPEVVFDIDPIQTSLSFSISWSAIDPTGTTTPSGLDAFYIQYDIISNTGTTTPTTTGVVLWYSADEQEEEWQDWEVDQILELGEEKDKLTLLGRDEHTYYFQIQAEDKAGNLSDWQEATTNITLPKTILITEVQVADDEFIELYNYGEQDINLSSWYFSYFSASRDWNDPWRNKEFPDEATILTGNYYLIGLEGYPTPDADWQIYSSSQLSNTAGAVAIFPWDPKTKSAEEAQEGRVDALGWGEVEVKESSSSAVSPSGQSLTRKIENQEYQDTDNNSADFEINNIPTPTNSKGETSSPGD